MQATVYRLTLLFCENGKLGVIPKILKTLPFILWLLSCHSFTHAQTLFSPVCTLHKLPGNLSIFYGFLRFFFHVGHEQVFYHGCLPLWKQEKTRSQLKPLVYQLKNNSYNSVTVIDFVLDHTQAFIQQEIWCPALNTTWLCFMGSLWFALIACSRSV